MKTPYQTLRGLPSTESLQPLGKALATEDFTEPEKGNVNVIDQIKLWLSKVFFVCSVEKGG